MDAQPPQSARRAAKSRSSFLKWLASLWPELSFHEPFESQFQAWYRRNARKRMRQSMLPAMGLLLVCTLAGGPLENLRNSLFAPQQRLIIDVLRFGVFVPTCIAMLLVIYIDLYSRWQSFASQAVMLLQGLCFIGLDVLMQPQGYSLSSLIPLVVLSSFMMFGLLHYQAMRISIVLVLAYGLAGWLAGLDSGQRRFDFCVVAFAGLMGFVVHYGFAKAVRYNWFKNQLLNDSAHRDSLTGIANRRMFDEHIGRLWQQAIRVQAPIALLLIDLDYFKKFNDHFGHQAGDHCIARVAGAIARAARRPLDLAARYGGEEFVVLLYDVRRERVEELCRDLHAGIAALAIAHPACPINPQVTTSIGAACVEPIAGRRFEGLIQLADEALYAAKERGRNRTVIMDREYDTLETGAFRVPRSRNGAAA